MARQIQQLSKTIFCTSRHPLNNYPFLHFPPREGSKVCGYFHRTQTGEREGSSSKQHVMHWQFQEEEMAGKLKKKSVKKWVKGIRRG
jgi:hypothetical protein